MTRTKRPAPESGPSALSDYLSPFDKLRVTARLEVFGVYPLRFVLGADSWGSDGGVGFVVAFVLDRVLGHPLALVRAEHLGIHLLAVGRDHVAVGRQTVVRAGIEVEEHVARPA